MANINDFMNSGKYLPKFMRDFHAQKRLFKSIDEMVDRAKERDKKLHRYGSEYPNWIMAHVYVIDIFLWYMALHGYTLQKSRKQCKFDDIHKTLEDWDKRSMESMRAFIGPISPSPAPEDAPKAAEDQS
jgi:hypothetical protein